MRTTLCQIIHRNLNKSKTTGDVRINSKILITEDSNTSILSPRHRKKKLEKKKGYGTLKQHIKQCRL